jgi:adenylosuccinate synthase
MTNIAILDPSWGDNGKGRCAHYFAPKYGWVVRAQGSSNCGHQVFVNGKSYVHHLLPSADYRYKTKSFLANGMVINLDELYQEIKEFSKDFAGIAKSIYVDPDAFIITQKHIDYDKEHNKHIGSTNKGVGPAYTDKIARKGTRVYHCIRDNAEVILALKELGVNFIPILRLKEEFEKSSIIFEGSQSALLDINAGPDYPYLTSSDCTISGVYASGFHFLKIDKVYGCIKPYLTKSGNGNLPTEFSEEDASKIRLAGDEIGKTTGRNRRIGALDLPALRYGILKAGITDLILTKLDILDGEKSVKVCVSYGKEVFSPGDFYDLRPEYISMPGWEKSEYPTLNTNIRKND